MIVRKLGAEGIVTSITGEDLELQVGALRVRAKTYEVERKSQPPEEALAPARPEPKPAGSTALPEVNRPGSNSTCAGGGWMTPSISRNSIWSRGLLPACPSEGSSTVAALERYGRQSAICSIIPHTWIVGKMAGKRRRGRG